MFAIVTISGKQYKVRPGEVVTVEGHMGNVGKTITFSDVLLVSGDKKVSVGKPTVKNIMVTAKILSHGQGEKLHVRRFKAKSRYRKTKGFRPHETKLEIVSVSS